MLPVSKLPPASIHVKRHLSKRELRTIATALELLRVTPAGDLLDSIALHVDGDRELLEDDEIRLLAGELLRARKIKVCRTKSKQA